MSSRFSHTDRRCGRAHAIHEIAAILLGQRGEGRGVAAVKGQQFLGAADAEVISWRPVALHLLLNRLVQLAIPRGVAEKNMRGTVSSSFGIPRARRVNSIISATQPWPQW